MCAVLVEVPKTVDAVVVPTSIPEGAARRVRPVVGVLLVRRIVKVLPEVEHEDVVVRVRERIHCIPIGGVVRLSSGIHRVAVDIPAQANAGARRLTDNRSDRSLEVRSKGSQIDSRRVGRAAVIDTKSNQEQ